MPNVESYTEYSGEQYKGKVYASDVRYGETFLNAEFIRKAAPGEVIKDPMTGELFIKRAIDGKIISFAQKSRTVYDFLHEFNLQFQSALRYKYPDYAGSFLIGTWFDVNTMLTKQLGSVVNIYDHLLTFPSTDVNMGNVFKFMVSPDTNGVFIKASPRNGDKNAIAYLSGKFSLDESANFGGLQKTFREWLLMHLDYKSSAIYDTWRAMTGWESSNMLIEATFIVSGRNASGSPASKETSKTYPMRLGEAGYMEFPENYADGIKTITSITVRIDRIHMPKIQYEYFLMTVNANSSSGMLSPLAELIEADHMACMKIVECYYFITDVDQLPFGDNRTVHQMVDAIFFNEGIDKMLTASGTRSVQSQPLKPATWGIDSLWLEETRRVHRGNTSTPTGSENDFRTIEKYIYDPTADIALSFTNNDASRTDILVKRA